MHIQWFMVVRAETRIGRKTNLMGPLSRQRAKGLEELASARPGAQGVHLYP